MTALTLASSASSVLVAADLAAEGVELLEDLVALQVGELAELEPDHRLGLGLGHAVDVGQARVPAGARRTPSSPMARFRSAAATSMFCKPDLRLGPARRTAADGDHLVERRDGDELAFEDVAAALRLAEQVLRPPADHLDPVVQELLHHLLEGQELRPAVHQGQQADAHRLLQRAVLVELVEDQVRVGVALQLDDEPDRLAGPGRRLVADAGDVLDPLVLDQLADVGGELVPRDLVRAPP